MHALITLKKKVNVYSIILLLLKEITVMSWSNCGRYIAAGTNNGFIFVWNVSSKVIVLHAECKERYSLRSLVWCPKNDVSTLAYCDDHGQLGVIDKACFEDHFYKDSIEVIINCIYKFSCILCM